MEAVWILNFRANEANRGGSEVSPVSVRGYLSDIYDTEQRMRRIGM